MDAHGWWWCCLPAVSLPTPKKARKSLGRGRLCSFCSQDYINYRLFIEFNHLPQIQSIWDFNSLDHLVARGHGELGLARSRATADSAMELGWESKLQNKLLRWSTNMSCLGWQPKANLVLKILGFFKENGDRAIYIVCIHASVVYTVCIHVFLKLTIYGWSMTCCYLLSQ